MNFLNLGKKHIMQTRRFKFMDILKNSKLMKLILSNVKQMK